MLLLAQQSSSHRTKHEKNMLNAEFTTAGRKAIDPKGDGGWRYNFLKPLITWRTPGLIPRYNGEQYGFGSAPFELSLLSGYRRRLTFVTDSKSELSKYLV